MKKYILFATLAVIGLISFLINKNSFSPANSSNPVSEKAKTSGAGIAMDIWSFERSYPYDAVPVSKYVAAFEEKKRKEAQGENRVPGEWESLGPQNIGGRTLSLAFHPTNPDIIFSGSASGGLWKTTTQGVGVLAWQFVPTGFPVLGVGAIAIDPNNPDIMFIGTGETYGTGYAEPGTINRLTRGTYGIGVLKSTDAGSSWSQVLSFDMDEIKGVNDLEINPQNTQEIFAATTDGVYRSLNGGANWTLVFNQSNSIDVEIDPNNGTTIYVSQGNFNNGLDPNLCGIFKSTNGGNTFNELLDPGLLGAWSGNAKLALDPTNSTTIYASIQVGWYNTGTTTPAGIYKSTNAGTNWTKVNDQNIALYQGWYSHDIAINPANPSEVINVGIDAWKSTDGGNNFVKKSNWQAWPNGQIDINVPQGGPSFVHGDIHGVYYHPLVANKVFYVTDGGVFSSEDGGETFVTHNGGLQTGQFYPNVGSSATNSNFLIAGAQDNNSYIYRGDPSWYKIIGGDGMSASVNQDNDAIVYGSYQFIQGLQKSTNNGNSFFSIAPTLVTNDYSAFLAPYELAPSNQEVMYAGATYLYKSIDGGDNWIPTANQSVDGANVIINIAISPQDPNVVIVATSPDPLGNFGTTPKLFKSTNGGQSFSQLTGLPNRLCKDIEFDPTDDNIVYATFSGFGTSHIYKSINGGDNWTAIDNGLPDVPTNTIAIDPLNIDDLYVGNDLGVYYSETGGASWEIFNDALPEATMIYDLNVSPSNRKIRIATHGHGIWQRNFVKDPLSVDEFSEEISTIKIFPNPTSGMLNIAVENVKVDRLTVYSISGKKLFSQVNIDNSIDVSGLANGVYFLEMVLDQGNNVQKFIKQ